MRIAVVNGDARMMWAAEMAERRGHEVQTLGWPLGKNNCDFPYELRFSDAVLLPLPDSSAALHQIAPYLPTNQKIVCGRLSEELESMAIARGWRLYRIQAEEGYALQNALTTAEGAICAVMQKSAFALCRSKCLVIGYGRIGKCLLRLLHGLGARVYVAARRRESRLDALGAGAEQAFSLADMPRALMHMDAVFSTVPSPVMAKKELAVLPAHALVVDLSSPPYGVDLAAAEEVRLCAWRESAVPGRFAPMTAAENILDYLEETINVEAGDEK